MMLKRFTAPLIAAAILGGCEAAEEPAVENTPSEESTQAAASTAGNLTPINRSGVRGSAEAVTDGDELVVTVEAEGMEGGGRYAAYLHEGRCADGGPVRLPLGRIEVEEGGEGSLTMRVEPERVPTGPEFFVQLHAPDDQPVACANVGPGATGS